MKGKKNNMYIWSMLRGSLVLLFFVGMSGCDMIEDIFDEPKTPGGDIVVDPKVEESLWN